MTDFYAIYDVIFEHYVINQGPVCFFERVLVRFFFSFQLKLLVVCSSILKSMFEPGTNILLKNFSRFLNGLFRLLPQSFIGRDARIAPSLTCEISLNNRGSAMLLPLRPKGLIRRNAADRR